jgi:D-2-hydroxyacid dehydrogenase (NADP+)
VSHSNQDGGLRVAIMDGFCDKYVHALEPKFPDVTFLQGRTADEIMPHMPEADVLFAFAPWIEPRMIAAAPRLGWIQALTTGVDNIWKMEAYKDHTLVTTVRGVHGPQVAELGFLYMLALVRRWRHQQANQAAHKWERNPQSLLWRKTVTVVGLGVIGEAFARRAKAFEMNVIGVSGTVRDLPDFDEVMPRDRLSEAVGRADFVVVFAPYTPENHNLIDAEVIGAMRPDAYLINLARGGVVDEGALLKALDEDRIAGVGLDVFTTEPLPADAPWWDHPKVLLSSHIGGMSDVYEEQVMPILEHNLRAFIEGRADDFQNRAERPSKG